MSNNLKMDPHVTRSLRAPEIDTLVELLQTAFPENEKIKTGVIPLLSSKKAYVKILLDKWDNRVVPALSAMETQHNLVPPLYPKIFGALRAQFSYNTDKEGLY